MKGKNNFFKGFFNWTFLGIVVVAIVLINIISSYVGKRFDMTEDERYSLSQGTEDFLTNDSLFHDRLSLRIYLAGKLPSEIKLFKNALEDKLKEFRKIAGKKIEYQFIDPHVGSETEKKELYETIYANGKGILPMDVVYNQDGEQNQLMMWPGAEIDYKGYTVSAIQFLPGTPAGKPYQLSQMNEIIQNSINNLEYMLVSAFKRVVKEDKPVVAFLQGHGELSFAQTQRARALISPNYPVKEVTLNDSIQALDGVDGLIIARPKTPFSDKDLFLIDQFVMRGGRLMCFLDALDLNEDTLNLKGTTHTTRIQTRLERMLFDYGLKLNDNYVIDAQCAPKPVPLAKMSLIPWFYHVLATPSSHPIARNLEPVSLKYASEVQFVGTKTRMYPILTSSTNSARTGMAPMVSLGIALNYGNNPQLVPNPKDVSNKVCLAGLSEGNFDSYFKNRIVDAYAKNKDARFLAKSSKEGKVMLVGNGRFLENQYDSMPSKMNGQMMYRPSKLNDLRYDPKLAELGIPVYYGNQEFIQNLVDYMMGDNTVLDIRSRQIDIHEIDKEKVKSEAGFYKFINLVLPCILILILAFILNMLRKKRYAK